MVLWTLWYRILEFSDAHTTPDAITQSSRITQILFGRILTARQIDTSNLTSLFEIQDTYDAHKSILSGSLVVVVLLA